MYYVSNVFVEKVFDQISHKQHTIEHRLESLISNLTVKIENVIDIREKELPFFDMKLSFTSLRMNNLSRFLVR